MNAEKRATKISYQIIGVLFEIFNHLGYKYQEKYYQRAIRESLKSLRLPFKEQVMSPLTFKGQSIGRFYFDFLGD